VARSVVGLTLQWVLLRYDLQWVYVGLRWVCGGGFDLRWPFGGSSCVGGPLVVGLIFLIESINLVIGF
jgi:hypothetical protein